MHLVFLFFYGFQIYFFTHKKRPQKRPILMVCNLGYPLHVKHSAGYQQVRSRTVFYTNCDSNIIFCRLERQQ
jgi:hypothetical protein